MAKDKSLSKEERKAAKKAAKAVEASSASSLAESAGVSKNKVEKKEKKDKKEKKAKLAERLLSEVEKADGAVVEVKGDKKVVVANVGPDGEVVSDEEMADIKKTAVRPIGALVPFANPLADEKVAKKMFRGVKKAAAQRTLKRGVKEVVKSLRKSQASAGETIPIGIVVLAADISPMDVISHIPVLCEDHSIPYIYVTSRAELGIAGQTKRPTSVVMISRDVPKGKKEKGEDKKEKDDGEDWSETYQGLVKVLEREGRHVKI